MSRAAMNGYKAFCRGREIEVHAETSDTAPVNAAKQFKTCHMTAEAVALFEENVLVDGYENAVRHSKQVLNRNFE